MVSRCSSSAMRVAGGAAPAWPATSGQSTMSPSSAGSPARRSSGPGSMCQLVHREGEHVGRARLAHPALVAARSCSRRRRSSTDSSASGLTPISSSACRAHGEHGVGRRPRRRTRWRPRWTLRSAPALAPARRRRRAPGRPSRRARRGRAAPAAPARRPSARTRRRCRRPAGGGRRRRWSAAAKWTSSTPSRISRTTRSPLLRAAGQVDLGDVAGDDDLGAEAEPGEEHLHLLGRGVLRLVQDDERVVERAAAHVRQRRDLDRARWPSAAGSTPGRSCRAARRRAAAGTGRSSRRACRAGSRAARPPRPPAGSG